MSTPRGRCVTAAAAMLAAGAARAQLPAGGPPDEGPIIVGKRREDWESFSLEHFEAALEFYAHGQRDEVSQTGVPTTEDKESRFRETLNLAGRAFVGHQNFLDVIGTCRLGLEDIFLDSQTLQVDSHESNFANSFDIQALLLGNGPVPTTFYARRDEQVLNRDFAPSINSTSTEYGVAADVRSEVAPTNVRLFHLENEQSDPTGLSDYSSSQDTFEARSRIRLGEAHYLDVHEQYDRVEENLSLGTDVKYDRNDFSLDDLISFGEDNDHELRSYFRYYTQTDRPELQILRLDEHLLLRHTDKLETRYNLSADQQQREGVEQRLLLGSARMRHQLFESLVTTGTVGGDVFEIPGDFESQGAFVDGGLAYSKLVPLGRLEAGLNLGLNTQHNGERGEDISVVDQSATFDDPLPIIIPRRNVVPGSLVVTGPGGLPTYQEGIDYIATYYPDRVEITRIIGGAISNNETVLVDYVMGPEPASDIDTTVGSATFRYSITEGMLTGLSPYGAYRFVDNSVSSASPNQIPLDDVTTFILGVDYHVGGLTLKVEGEHRDSTFTPYDSMLYQAIYSYRLGPESSLYGEATYQTIDSPDPTFQFTYLFLKARWNQRLATGLVFRAEVQYIENHNEQSGDSTGFEQIIGLNWRRGRTSVYGTLRNATLDGQSANLSGIGPTFQDTTSQSFEFGITRSF